MIECDEDQHRNYQNEKSRMWKIKQKLNKPCIFIRFNPDSYKTSKGKTGQSTPETQKETLLNCVTKLLKSLNAPRDVSVLYLFYDGWDGKAELEELEP